VVGRVLVAAVACATLTLQALSPETESDRQTRTVALPPGRTLSLAITVGNVRIQGEPRSDAIVEIARTAPTRAGFARIPIAIDESSAAVSVTGVQTENGTDPAYRTDVTLRVPERAALASVQVMEGRLTITALKGSITAEVRRGAIEATDLEGSIRLTTEIGDIVARAMRLTAGGVLRLRTFNGDVRLMLAEPPKDARILALALNGTIESDIPLRTKEAWGPRSAETSIGKGEPVISIDVVTGKIEIRVK
jgi:DUF4097 and DUF4098 domain-containing protein YvlB